MSSPNDNERAPSLQEVIARALSAFGRRLPVSLPAKVTKYDASKQRADCKVLVQRPYFDEEDERQVESIPIVPGVPVQFPGSKWARLTFPISDGNLQIEGETIPATTGLLIWCDRSIDKWLTGKGDEVDPEIDHDHAFADAVFVPGVNPFGDALSSCPTDQASIGSDSDGNGRIHFKKSKVLLGDGATKQVARKGDKTKTTISVTMGTGPLSASIASITVTDPTTGLPNVLTTGNLSGDAAGEITGGSEHVVAVD